jgi:hypothetical protein
MTCAWREDVAVHHSPFFAPVPESTIKTALTVASVALLDVLDRP